MGRSDRSVTFIRCLRERMHAIDLELKGRVIVPDEADEPAEQDRLPVGRYDEIREIRAVRLSFERRQLEMRLAQLDDGEEIVCTECEEPIAIDRLLAVLTATRCVRCQEHVERTNPRIRLQECAVA